MQFPSTGYCSSPDIGYSLPFPFQRGLEVRFPSAGYCFSSDIVLAGSAVSKRGLLFFLSTLKSIIVISTMFLARIIVTDHIRYEIFQRHPTIAGRNLPANSLVET